MRISKPKVLLRSLAAAYLLSGLLLLALSFALYRLKLNEAQINSAVYAVYGAACLLGGYLAGRGIPSRRFFWGLLAGLLYFAVLLAVTWAMNRGQSLTPDLTRSATVLGCCAIGGMAGGMMS